MASEPNPKVDELLKAYAKKRRDQAGAPFELHSATRNLLQAEVARHRGKSADSKPVWLRSFMLHWPRFALSACILAVAVVGAVLWSGERQSKRAELQLALKDPDLQQEIPTVPGLAGKEMEQRTPPAVVEAQEAGGAGFHAPSEPVINPLNTARERFFADGSPRTKPPNFEAGKDLTEDSFDSGGTRLNRSVGSDPKVEQTSLGLGLAKAKDELAAQSSKSQPESSVVLNESLGEEKLSRRLAAASPRPNANEQSPFPTSTLGVTVPALQSTVSQQKESVDRLGARPAQQEPESERLLRRQIEPSVKQLSLASESQETLPGRALVADPTVNRHQTVYSFQNNSSRQRWIQASSSTTKQPASDAKLATILNAFEVEQTGNALRITEPDGSSYEGQILDMPLTASAERTTSAISPSSPSPPPALAASRTTANAEKRQSEPSASLPNDSYVSGIQNVYFRAAGTNRSLKQPVIISGNFVVNTGHTFNNTLYFQNAPPSGTGQTDGHVGGIILPVDRLEGKALVGGAQEVLINATPQISP
jgi:hypothetical protein